MKTFNLLVSIFIAAGSFSLSAQYNEPEPVTLQKISDNLYLVTGGRGANGGMYIGENEIVVIDSKMDKASVDGIYEAAKKVSDKPIAFLINTHSDGDHINGNRFFPEEVKIIAHENCRKEFLGPQRDGLPSEWQSADMIQFVPEITFNDKLQLHLGTQIIELHYFGVGHTTGDAVVYFPDEKTAFIGDQVFFERPQLIHSYKGGNSFEHVKTTKNMLASLGAEKFCSGHSDIKTRADVEQHLKEITALQEKIIALEAEGKSLAEVQSEFAENESRLVESVYNEVQRMK